ncbi:hypothetical protein EDB81DRAFT_769469 [Dactylonectria macrodidyma]|uniref:Nephrocystin 3-like N-terminal domain-containing protein n=1 Tax=Dactylonectria macrodidyma TaxID=307937 RepID=A0A9P9JI72_9HYPO|nr:hypothetical protein EDB81DRAFT_769469 [Dactylonectria macrodidyma]
MHTGDQSEWAASALLSMLQQVYMGNSIDEDFPVYLIEKNVLQYERGKLTLRTDKIATVLARLLDMNPQRKWIVLVHDLDSLRDDVKTEVGKMLGGLIETSSTTRTRNLRVAMVGGDLKTVPELSRHFGVIHNKTEYSECLASLQFDNMNNRRDRIIPATIGTNQWVWDNPSYLAWESKESAAIWIAGKPGSGKSVLAKTMQEKLLSQCETTQSLVASWFYSARDNLTVHKQMISAVLHQLLAQDTKLFAQMKWTYRSVFMQHDGQLSNTWPVVSLKEAMSAIFTNPPISSRSCLIVADGLDEANINDVGNDCTRRDALRFMLGLTLKALPLKIIFLSRPFDDINKILKDQYFISMHHVNRPDIVFLIERGVEDLTRRLDGYDSDDEYPTAQADSSSSADYFQKAHHEKKEMVLDVENYLKVNAKGVVLWVTTVIDILKRNCKEEPLYDLKALKKHLEGLPLDLSRLYCRITADLLQSFKGSQTTLEKSRRALMWVSVATQYPLQLQDLLEIISHDFSSPGNAEVESAMGGFSDWLSFKRSVERLCGPFIEFITVNAGTKSATNEAQWLALQLSHESVRTFLQQDPGSLELGFSSTEAERRVREERRRYMREALPTLKPMLFSSIYQKEDGRQHDFCRYMESRPLMCFILLTLDFELQEVISRPDRKATLANEFGQSANSTSVFFVFPFLNAASLLRACGFFHFTEPGYPSSLFSCEGGTTLLEHLFLVACAEGKLNAVNVLLTLIIYPNSDQVAAIAASLKDAARQASISWEVLGEPRHVTHVIRPLSSTPKFTECRRCNVVTSASQVASTISQVFVDGILKRSQDTLEMRWGISFHDSPTNLSGILRSKDNRDHSIYRRTPFTKVKGEFSWEVGISRDPGRAGSDTLPMRPWLHSILRRNATEAEIDLATPSRALSQGSRRARGASQGTTGGRGSSIVSFAEMVEVRRILYKTGWIG